MWCKGIYPRYQVLSMDFKKRAKGQRCCYYCQPSSDGSPVGPLEGLWRHSESLLPALLSDSVCVSPWFSGGFLSGAVEILSWLGRRVAFKSQCKLGQC